MVQATGKPVYGKLDWDASRQYLWQGNTYIDVPFVFEKGNRYLTVQQAPPTTFNLVVRKTRNNQFEGAIRTTTYTRGEAENLSKGRREAGLVVQSYQWLNGQDANIWVGQENERQARAGKRLQLSATEIAALRAEAENRGSDSAAGTLARSVLQQQVCDVMVYTSYRTVCWYPTASDEAAMNATCMSVPVLFSVEYCYNTPIDGTKGFPPDPIGPGVGGGENTLNNDGLTYEQLSELQQLENENYKRSMTKEELEIYEKMPSLNKLDYLRNANFALKNAQEIFPTFSQHNDKADAYRHALFSLLNVRTLGFDLARQLGDAHELAPNQPELERQMDLFNNNIGRNAHESSISLPMRALELIYSGKLVYIRNGGLVPTNE